MRRSVARGTRTRSRAPRQLTRNSFAGGNPISGIPRRGHGISEEAAPKEERAKGLRVRDRTPGVPLFHGDSLAVLALTKL